MIPGSQSGTVHVSQYDTNREIEFDLMDESGYYEIPSGASVKLMGTKPSGYGFTALTTFTGHTVKVVTPSGMTNEAGLIPVELRVTAGQQLLGTANFILDVEGSPHVEGTVDDEIYPPTDEKLYGAKWDRLTNKLTRTRDAAQITTDITNFKHSGTVNANYNNPFDVIYPWSDMQLVNVDMTKYRAGTYTLEECIKSVYGNADFTYFGTKDLFVGRYRPEFWYRSSEDPAGNVEFLISPVQRAGFTHAEPCIDGISFAIDADGTYITSGAGVPLTNIQVQQIHSRAKTSGFTLQDINSIDAQIMLYLVEFADMNIQNALGNGCSDCYRQNAADTVASVSVGSGTTTITINDSALSGVIYVGAQLSFGTSVGATTYKANVKSFTVSGSTYTIVLDKELSSLTTGMYASVHGFMSCEFPYLGQNVGNGSGYIGTNGKANAFYRGTLLYANRYSYILGIYRQQNTNHLWVCPSGVDPDDYDALNTSYHLDTEVALPTLTAAGWQTVGGNAQRIPSLSGFMATGESSGSSSSPVGDQQYVPLPTAGNAILLFGGFAVNGWVCGVFCGVWDGGASASYWYCAGLPLLKNPL